MRAIQADWENIKTAVCGGIPYRDVSRSFNVKEMTIRQRAFREKWPTPANVQAKIEELRARIIPSKPLDNNKLSTEKGQDFQLVNGDMSRDLTTMIASDWLTKGEEHRQIMYKISQKALSTVSKRAQKLENWQDIERADKAARRATGLDGGDEAKVNVSLTLVNQRIMALQGRQ